MSKDHFTEVLQFFHQHTAPEILPAETELSRQGEFIRAVYLLNRRSQSHARRAAGRRDDHGTALARQNLWRSFSALRESRADDPDEIAQKPVLR